MVATTVEPLLMDPPTSGPPPNKGHLLCHGSPLLYLSAIHKPLTNGPSVTPDNGQQQDIKQILLYRFTSVNGQLEPHLVLQTGYLHTLI